MTTVKGQETVKVKSLNVWKFIIPSLLGVLIFLVPIKVDGEITIGIGVLASSLLTTFENQIPAFLVIMLGVTVFFTLYAVVLKPKFIMDQPFFKSVFYTGPFGITMRLIGFLVGVMAFYNIGPEFISSRNTGGVVLYDLAPVLLTWFLFAGILLPLLVEFGLMEFVGSLLQKVMRPLFTLPGRSSIDTMASWMGAGTVGVLVTMKQYDQGYYTKREAAVIATTFSIASVAFSLVIAQVIGIGHLFIPFYLTVTVASIVAAIIMPRIPPLSRKADTYYEPVGQQIDETIPEGVSAFQWGWQQALETANKGKSPKRLIQDGVETVLDIWLGLIPLVMSLGAIALILAEFTPVFQIMSYPIVPLLEWMRIPEAADAAPTMLVGFADMFLPAVIGSGLESELTKFIVAALSLTQLVYMSEIGILILRSNIPVSFLDLFVIFIQRTIITLPIIVIIAHFFIFR
ncbi:YjiH family protein [Sporosarcina sp. Marseille-Q4063]|uniref:YjiH family protein n=1 Tax=Sporosarcina sp. Marseille-Q4063 TaxID=2810514 RepID=UPI001BAF5220|nr:YjiH family protein [Sporosarcina sp. Marseille-Q4063]QUW23194.1 YjiH family protein [Sporosarcina sp. Marseille-Q4063]